MGRPNGTVRPPFRKKRERMGHPPSEFPPFENREGWGTQGEMGHPSQPHNLGNLGPSVPHANLNM